MKNLFISIAFVLLCLGCSDDTPDGVLHVYFETVTPPDKIYIYATGNESVPIKKLICITEKKLKLNC